MKKAFLIAALALAGGTLWGQDFTATQHRHFTTTQNRPAKIYQPKPADGAVQKAFRMSNPLQALNPFAPKEYGDGSECVYHDENDHFQQQQGRDPHPKGIRLFAFSW